MARGLIPTRSVTAIHVSVVVSFSFFPIRTALNRTLNSYVCTRSKFVLLTCALINSRLYTAREYSGSRRWRVWKGRPNFSCRVKTLQGFSHSTLFTTVDAIHYEMNISWQVNRDLIFTEDLITIRFSLQLLIWSNPVRPIQTRWSAWFWYQSVQRQSKKHKSGHCRTNAIINVMHLLDVSLVDWFQALYYLAVWFAWVGTFFRVIGQLVGVAGPIASKFVELG